MKVTGKLYIFFNHQVEGLFFKSKRPNTEGENPILTSCLIVFLMSEVLFSVK